jgi:hypothetical protein
VSAICRFDGIVPAVEVCLEKILSGWSRLRGVRPALARRRLQTNLMEARSEISFRRKSMLPCDSRSRLPVWLWLYSD